MTRNYLFNLKKIKNIILLIFINNYLINFLIFFDFGLFF